MTYPLLTVTMERVEPLPWRWHCWLERDYLGAFDEQPQTARLLEEVRGPDGRWTLYRATLPDGREFIVSGSAWECSTVVCFCPGRFRGDHARDCRLLTPPTPLPGPPQLTLALETC